MRPFKAPYSAFADHMTNVGRKYRSMTYHPLARTHALTHTCAGLSLWIRSLLLLQQNLIRNLMYEATSNLKGGFEVPVNTPKRGGRTQRGCTQSAEKLRLTCFPLQNPTLWGLSDSENQHLHCAQKPKEKKTSKSTNC